MPPGSHEALFPTESVDIGCYLLLVASTSLIFAATAVFWHSPAWFGRAAALLTTRPRRFTGSSKDRAKKRTHGAIRRHGRTLQTLKIYLCWGCERLLIGVI